MNDETQDFFEGIFHALCAVVSAIEKRDPGAKGDVLNSLNTTIDWLAAHDAPLTKAVPALQLRDWIIDPPRNPSDPFAGPPPRRPSVPAAYRDAGVLIFPKRWRGSDSD